LGLPETMPSTDTRFADARFEAEWRLLQAACSATANRGDSGQEQNQDQEKEEEKEKEKEKRGARSLLQRPLNWEALVQLAERHGVVPILYHSLPSLGSEVPPATLAQLKQGYETNLRRTLLLARELIRILDRFDALAIDVLPYKGVSLAETLYGDIALRQAGDIDLLVRASDLSRIKATLKELGYTPHLPLSEPEQRAYLGSGYECAFDSLLGRNLLEVQWALQPRFYAVDFETESVFRRAIPVNVAGRNMKTPSAEDQFLILALHAAKHVWGRLIWLCDIAQIVKSPALNWNWISETARSLGIVRILQVTLVLTNRMLGVAIPAAAEKSLSADSAARALADEIAPQIGRSTPQNVESLSYFRLMLRLRERRADRIRFLRRLAFTPGPGEWKSVRLPASLFPLYRLVRLWRLATRLAKT
jgi:hypothetical protein